MKFGTIRYMNWFKTRNGAKYDLCCSGVESLSMADLELGPGDLELSGEDFYGYPPLLEAIAGRFDVESENVVSTLGTSQGLFLSCAALLSPGDRILVEKPVYGPLLAVPGAFEVSVTRFERRYEEGYGIGPDEFEEVMPPDTRLVLLTNLHNPSGALLSDPEILSIASAAERAGAVVLVDEVYLNSIEALASQTAFHLAENIITISSLGKVYGLGDLRCGWILAPPDLTQRIRKIIDYVNVEGVFIGERISRAAFDQLDTLRERAGPRLNRNREILGEFIEGEAGLSWVEPAGGVVCFPRVEAGFSGDDLATHLMEKYDTGVVPGSLFEEPGHIRIGFGGGTDILNAALANIEKAIEDLTG